MTEAEWLKCEDIEEMLECLVALQFPDAEPCNWGKGERKKRLFIAACIRRIWSSIPTEYKLVIEQIELDTDGGSVVDEMRANAWSVAEGVTWQHSRLLFSISYDDISSICYISSKIASEARTNTKEASRDSEDRVQAVLLRDIFGNPFRPVAFVAAWRTDTALSLARHMYESRDFSAMPILADALQDAGCDHDDMLNHCRGEGPHVRGCWVVDLVLGKE